MATDFFASYFGDRKIKAGFFWDTIVAGSLVIYYGARNIIAGVRRHFLQRILLLPSKIIEGGIVAGVVRVES